MIPRRPFTDEVAREQAAGPRIGKTRPLFVGTNPDSIPRGTVVAPPRFSTDDVLTLLERVW